MIPYTRLWEALRCFFAEHLLMTSILYWYRGQIWSIVFFCQCGGRGLVGDLGRDGDSSDIKNFRIRRVGYVTLLRALRPDVGGVCDFES